MEGLQARAALEDFPMQTVKIGRVARKKTFNWTNFQRDAAPYIFVSPFFVLFLIFGLFPLLFSLFLSFNRWDSASGLSTMRFIGPRNYVDTWTDPLFWKALKNTFYIALLSGVPQHLIAIPAAYVLNTLVKRFKHFFTAALFVPFITSVVAISLITTVLFSERQGVINQAIRSLHNLPLISGLFPADNIRWLFDQNYVPVLIALVVVWKYTGYNIVLYLAGLQTIPQELYEAAQVDGATRSQQFRFITLPLLRPIAFYAVTLSLIGNLNLFTEPFILVGTQYGQNQAGMTMGAYLYKMAFELGFADQAAAMSWMFFVVVVALTLINNRLFRARD